MRSARYRSPHVQLQPRIAYVIAGYLKGNCLKDYGDYKERKLDTYRFNLACQQHYPAGLPYDLIFVDNGSDHEDGIALMKHHRYLRRENEGFSFGAWKHAWEHTRGEYDYYLFTEDDHVPCQDNWLGRILDAFRSAPDVGAVGNYIETRGRTSVVEIAFFKQARSDRDVMHNLDGGWTFTSADVLRKVDQVGGLPVDPKTYPSTNEVCFHGPMLELGYQLLCFADEESYFVHGTSWIEPGPESERPLETLTPLVNCNARAYQPALRKHFAWYES